MYAAPVDCMAASAHTLRRPTAHGAVVLRRLIRAGTIIPCLPGMAIRSLPRFNTSFAKPASSILGSAPIRCPPRPCIAVKKISIPPIPIDDAHTCWGANGDGFLLEKDHIEKAGEDWIPMSAKA
jgi:hypothetical protein